MRPHLLKPLLVGVAFCVASLVAASPGGAATMGSSHAAAMQAALSQKGHYIGTIDGLVGPLTQAAVGSFQAEVGLRVTRKANARTVEALGGPARGLQSRTVVRQGDIGWDVVRLQFLLAWHGFPSGELDGVFGERAQRAAEGFQRWAGLPADGIAGPATFRALRKPPVRLRARLSMPVAAVAGDSFGPRGDRFHAGLDLPVDEGTLVGAAKAGRVAYAAFHEGGFGNLVVIQHRNGLRTRYGHLSEFAVQVGEPVRRGQTIGLAGSTGRSSGPHVHVEALFRGALVDPLPLLTR